MSWLSSFLHPERGYKKALEELQKHFNDAQGHLNPYNQNGINQSTNLTNSIDALMHPEKLYDEWNKNYTESEAAKQDEIAAQEEGVDAANSMGLGGSNTALTAIQSGKHNIMEHDRRQYLDDLMNKYTTGIGVSQGLYNTGANAAGQMGQNSMNMGQNSAGLKYGQTNAQGEMLGHGANMIMKLIEEYLTGGMGHGSYGRGSWS